MDVADTAQSQIELKRLPPGAQELIAGLLQVDVSVRFGFERCLRHPWVNNGRDPVSLPVPTEPPWVGELLQDTPAPDANVATSNAIHELQSRLSPDYQGIFRLKEL